MAIESMKVKPDGVQFGRIEEEFFYNHPDGIVIGIDEAARGTLVGSMHAAAVALDAKAFSELQHVAIDSKKTRTPEQRKALQEIITGRSVAYANDNIPAKIINEGLNLDILNLQAMQGALDSVLSQINNQHILVLCDATRLPPQFKGKPVPTTEKGEAHHVSVASASILAKYAFDLEIMQLHLKYPRYKFLQHSGYATKSHLGKIRTLGYLPEHRIVYKTFTGMKPNNTITKQ